MGVYLVAASQWEGEAWLRSAAPGASIEMENIKGLFRSFELFVDLKWICARVISRNGTEMDSGHQANPSLSLPNMMHVDIRGVPGMQGGCSRQRM